MEWAVEHDVPDVAGRYLAVDDEGIGMRATWRPARGLINLSLWRGNDCVEAFHLTPREAASFAAFLVGRLADAVPTDRSSLRLVEHGAAASAPRTSREADVGKGLRRELASVLERAAAWVRP